MLAFLNTERERVEGEIQTDRDTDLEYTGKWEGKVMVGENKDRNIQRPSQHAYISNKHSTHMFEGERKPQTCFFLAACSLEACVQIHTCTKDHVAFVSIHSSGLFLLASLPR